MKSALVLAGLVLVLVPVLGVAVDVISTIPLLTPSTPRAARTGSTPSAGPSACVTIATIAPTTAALASTHATLTRRRCPATDLVGHACGVCPPSASLPLSPVLAHADVPSAARRPVLTVGIPATSPLPSSDSVTIVTGRPATSVRSRAPARTSRQPWQRSIRPRRIRSGQCRRSSPCPSRAGRPPANRMKRRVIAFCESALRLFASHRAQQGQEIRLRRRAPLRRLHREGAPGPPRRANPPGRSPRSRGQRVHARPVRELSARLSKSGAYPSSSPVKSG